MSRVFQDTPLPTLALVLLCLFVLVTPIAPAFAVPDTRSPLDPPVAATQSSRAALAAGTIALVSRASGGTPRSAGSFSPASAVHGRDVASHSDASYLVPGDPNSGSHGFVHKRGQAEPPFSGTIFIDPDILTSADPTTFQGAPYAGRGSRTMFDRRVNDWITVEAYLFDARFDDGLTAEIQVNPEFGSSDAALVEAQKYGEVIGRLPTALRADVETVWIHKGTQPFGGGNNNLLIHTGQADTYAADGILEETFVHEAAHTSFDATHASAPDWRAAQAADGTFISTYARDFPDREDIAESFLPYLAVRYRSDRISQSLADTILQTIPNRLAYFDNQSFNMHPIEPTSRDFFLFLPVVTTVGNSQ